MKSWDDVRDTLSPGSGGAESDTRSMSAFDMRALERALVAADLRMAREAAHLTPERLASRVGKSASFIRESEAGNVVVDGRHLVAVLRACGQGVQAKVGRGQGGGAAS
jgi:ribosome-binding protein aMBF1 (putative translation factor)